MGGIFIEARMVEETLWEKAKRHGLLTLFSAAAYVVLGFLAGQAYQADQLRKKSDDDHQKALQQVKTDVSISVKSELKPIREGFQGDLKEAMLMCREASFRSIRAANTVKEASDTASGVFDAQKEALKRELDK
ncbi:hypothetical protein [Advenella mimigardefordensis]|uniref:hypothetical protein n=1 Tax=Advenella mimigardefordensis TaxID=302406 RepID=UPI00046D74EF|nr:hypothetical protein [Advenella mimigardefordensis]